MAVRVFQRKRMSRKKYIYKFIMGIGSCDYWCWDMSQHADLYCLENKENRRCDPTQEWRSENQGSLWSNSPPEAEGLRMGGVYAGAVLKARLRPKSSPVWGGRRWPSQLRNGEVRLHPSSTYLFYAGSGPFGTFSLSLPIQMLISSGNNLTDTSRNNVLRMLWASLSPIKLIKIINMHKDQ